MEYLYRYGQEEGPASLIDIELALRREVYQQAQDIEWIEGEHQGLSSILSLV